jgi:hypothetical protein
MIRRIIAEFFALLAAFLFTFFAAGLVVGANANIFWPLFFAAACLLYYLFRPWMRDVLGVPAKAKQ